MTEVKNKSWEKFKADHKKGKFDKTPSGKDFWWNKVRKPLEEGEIISFCTNAMLGRGTVYTVKNVGGNAVIQSTHTWWAMAFSEKDISRAGEVLGEIKITPKPMVLRDFTLSVNGMKEGKG